MRQQSQGLGQTSKRTRRREFLEEMERVVPRSDLVAPYIPEGKRARLPFAVEVMLHISLHAAVVHAERPGDGGGAARRAAVPGVRRRGGLGRVVAGRIQDLEISARAGEAQAQRADPEDH